MSVTHTSNVDALRKEYDDLAAQVTNANPNAPDYFDLRARKKAAFVKWNEAALAKQKQDELNAAAETAQAAADAKAVEAKAAVKAAHAPAHTGPASTEKPHAGAHVVK